jgi:hypothetical protein
MQNTRSSREFMVTNPGKRLPKDYKRYPGKMDHATCLTFKVGSVSATISRPSLLSSETGGSSMDDHQLLLLPHSNEVRLAEVKQWDEPIYLNNNLLAHSPSSPISRSLLMGGLATPKIKPPVTLCVPLSVTVCETDSQVAVFCHSIASGQLQCTVDENRLFLQVFWSEDWSRITEQYEGIGIFGPNELDQPIERVVDLPAKVIPESKAISYDVTTGIITVTFTKKPIDSLQLSTITL